MPVQDFNGDTFVAFTDISGFKEMMNNKKQAVRALDRLNQAGFNVLRQNNDINGFFISDCGILFVRNINRSREEQLASLLEVVENINRRLLNDNIMLTTSIAYGLFSYHQRIEFQGIEKNPIYGNAYVAAFLDNENGKPKIQPGQCRILENENYHFDFPLPGRLKKKGNHHYFYWMVDHENEINQFETDYKDTYKLKYQGMLSALKRPNIV
jgi:hypothetical protein